jgi:hypothetical protein
MGAPLLFAVEVASLNSLKRDSGPGAGLAIHHLFRWHLEREAADRRPLAGEPIGDVEGQRAFAHRGAACNDDEAALAQARTNLRKANVDDVHSMRA